MTKKKYIILRDRELMLAPAHWTPISVMTAGARELYGTCPEWICQRYVKGRLQVFYLKDDFNRLENYISTKIFTDDEYFLHIAREVKRREEIIKKLFNKLEKINFTESSFLALLNLSQEIKNKSIYYESANMLGWFYGADKLAELIKNHLSMPETDFNILTTPSVKTAVSQLEYDLVEFTSLIIQKEISLAQATEILESKFGWIPHGFDGLDYWDKKYFSRKLTELIFTYADNHGKKLGALKEEVKSFLEKRKSLVNKYKLNSEQILMLKKLNTLAIWTDERKGLTFKLYSYYHKILKELESRYDIPFKNLKYLFTHELEEVPIDSSRVIEMTNKRIETGMVLEFIEDDFRILSCQESKKILNDINETSESSDKVKGNVASKGSAERYEGIIKVLLSAKEINKINNNEFLVATMTTPDYLPAMQKAAGFITDEGGVTCHAAIVAREMGKPCIIGTGNSTKVFKDGDKARVDVVSGEIIKID